MPGRRREQARFVGTIRPGAPSEIEDPQSWAETLSEAQAALAAGQPPSEETWARWIDSARAVEVITPVSEVVYYVQFADRVKIGYTSNLVSRLTAIPHDRVLAVERGGREVERLRHEQFATARIRGEWFQATPDLLAHCEALP